ncbi:hypothetical protein EIP86_007607 [Pleurotus ostreatoroseus]|nr:hypothetical protein EIP86_007607 [Pleurotus ostreatoroseus]
MFKASRDFRSFAVRDEHWALGTVLKQGKRRTADDPLDAPRDALNDAHHRAGDAVEDACSAPAPTSETQVDEFAAFTKEDTGADVPTMHDTMHPMVMT